MTNDIVIVGGGYAGVYSAWSLARAGRKVALVEQGDHLGGTMWSNPWKHYLVDIGTHHLDIRRPHARAFYSDILGANLEIIPNHVFGAVTGSSVTRGFEAADFSDDPSLCDVIQAEMARLADADSPNGAGSFADLLARRFGKTAGERLLRSARKIVGAETDNLDPAAIGNLAMLQRIKIGSDDQMILQKQAGDFWNERLGVTRFCGDQRFIGSPQDLVNFAYPATGALRAFCTAVHERLVALGVDIIFGQTVTGIDASVAGVKVALGNGQTLAANQLFWTLQDGDLGRLIGIDFDVRVSSQPVGAVVHAFEVNAGDLCDLNYVQDFSPDRMAYRYARTGVYSRQISPDGKTFALAEVPVHPSNRSYSVDAPSVARIWDEMKAIGFVQNNAAYFDHTTWAYPVAYALPKQGWRSHIEGFEKQVAEKSPRIHFIRYGFRGRDLFMGYFNSELLEKLAS